MARGAADLIASSTKQGWEADSEAFTDLTEFCRRHMEEHGDGDEPAQQDGEQDEAGDEN